MKKEVQERGHGGGKIVITLQSTFKNGVGFDSLDMVEFIMNMEKQFGIAIPDPMVEKIVTIQDAVTAIDRILKEKK